MLKFDFCTHGDSAYRVLCLGSHSDDIEIGCGGTILTLLQKNKEAIFHWIVFSSDQQRAREARESANTFLRDAKSKEIIIKNFRGGFLPYIGAEVKEYFEQLKEEFSPDLILTHYRNDLHQDHRLISELTWNTFRDHLILEYEIPKYDGDLGCPNLFVHLDESVCRRKIQYILDNFDSQRQKHWFGEETFLALLRLRGIESNAPSKYAEAFYCRKMVLG
jgi:LmbE family N-acetylglucosaminyl deacetylase